jgi:hypothetical protein
MSTVRVLREVFRLTARHIATVLAANVQRSNKALHPWQGGKKQPAQRDAVSEIAYPTFAKVCGSAAILV